MSENEEQHQLSNETKEDSFSISVMTLNTWGMPRRLGSKDKEVRMEGIGEKIQKGEQDVYLLQELWMRPDHEKIMSYLPEGVMHLPFQIKL